MEHKAQDPNRELIQAGKGKKPRRVRKPFPDKPISEGYIKNKDLKLFNPVEPGEERPFEILEAIHGFGQGKLLERGSISSRVKYAGRGLESSFYRISNVVENLFEGGYYISYLSQKVKSNKIIKGVKEPGLMTYSITSAPAFPQVLLAQLKVPNFNDDIVTFNNTGLEKNAIKKLYQIDPNNICLSVIFSNDKYKAERRWMRGLLLPLTSQDTRFSEEFQKRTGNLLVLRYMLPSVHYWLNNIFDYCSDLTEGLRIALNTKRNYEPRGS